MTARRQQGFTLLEVMLVALLMGLAAAAVVLSINNDPVKDQLSKQARKFVAVTEMALQEVTLSGRWAGIVVEDDHYYFVVYDDEIQQATESEQAAKERRTKSNRPKWIPITHKRQFQKRYLEQGMEFELTVDGLPLKQDEDESESWFDEPFAEVESTLTKKFPEPQVMLFPSGEISAFELLLTAKNDQNEDIEVMVISDSLGRMKILETEQDFIEADL
ncbi:type II secretion system minor pseudopilin GspH [Paraferrimonas sedimenticola]|uniref:Type II secretion system protein H n=1 Tax=Paraferrimonas sedimenticola TaxID=375674 RepID=A0AA37VUV3_9GAMM|nr:type II secretion system minor pseudopilin GspH [Paraferrimonas sedimenticola]GLP95921.1 type II secretion system protein GspH [Paraferrimonas sedimenticola]